MIIEHSRASLNQNGFYRTRVQGVNSRRRHDYVFLYVMFTPTSTAKSRQTGRTQSAKSHTYDEHIFVISVTRKLSSALPTEKTFERRRRLNVNWKICRPVMILTTSAIQKDVTSTYWTSQSINDIITWDTQEICFQESSDSDPSHEAIWNHLDLQLDYLWQRSASDATYFLQSRKHVFCIVTKWTSSSI